VYYNDFANLLQFLKFSLNRGLKNVMLFIVMFILVSGKLTMLAFM